MMHLQQIIRKSMKKNKENGHEQILRRIVEKNISIFTSIYQYEAQKHDANQEGIIEILIEEEKIRVIAKLQNAGFINSVYIFNGKYVVKIQDKIKDITVHQIELFDLIQLSGIRAPKLIDFGEFYGKKYILMTKLKGDRLWKCWNILGESQKQNVIQQLCCQLRKLHQIQFSSYSPRRPYNFPSAYEAIKWYNGEAFKLSTQKLENADQETRKNLSYLRIYFEENIEILKKQKQNAVLVHNDLHFGNILYEIETKQISGILDFDFSRQLNKDYELWHFIQFLAHPQLYVEKQFNSMWEDFEVGSQLKYMRRHYAQLFEDENFNLKQDLVIKLRLYFMDEILYFFTSGNLNQFNQKIYKLYKSNWLESILKTTL